MSKIGSLLHIRNKSRPRKRKPILYVRIAPPTVEALNNRDLLAAWKLYGHDPLTRFKSRKPLTAPQVRKLPRALRDRLD
jgi:hypothetical protein